jgi:hypothetical protein
VRHRVGIACIRHALNSPRGSSGESLSVRTHGLHGVHDVACVVSGAGQRHAELLRGVHGHVLEAGGLEGPLRDVLAGAGLRQEL